jgi:hypothetical protein
MIRPFAGPEEAGACCHRTRSPRICDLLVLTRSFADPEGFGAHCHRPRQGPQRAPARHRRQRRAEPPPGGQLRPAVAQGHCRRPGHAPHWAVLLHIACEASLFLDGWVDHWMQESMLQLQFVGGIQ